VHSAAISYVILTCRENLESNEAKWCILTLCETYARRHLEGARAGCASQTR